MPGIDIVVDESMIPFRGRLLFRQYMHGKSNKYGIKLFKLCDKTGYTYSVIVYTGKDNDGYGGIGLASSVILKLVEPYIKAGRTLSTDNFYTSLPLART